MATIKVVLRKKQNKDGTFPLAIRITKDRTSSFVYFSQNLHETDWDETNQRVKKSHPNSSRLNNLIAKKRAEINNSLLDLETSTPEFTPKAVTKTVKPKGSVSFFDEAEKFSNNLRLNGKYNRYQTEIGRIKHFREYLNGEDIAFSEITVSLLNGFRAFLKSTREISERTIINHLMLIRTIYNIAIKDGLTNAKNYPFGKGKIVIKFPGSIKIGLSPEEVKLIENVELEGYADHARNAWLVSFYFAGMRLSDVLRLKWSNLHDSRLFYAMGKNLKADSLKIPPKAQALLDKYKNDEQKHDLIFPELKVLDELIPFEEQRKISYASKRLDKSLKQTAKSLGITKNISMHIARHTFGNISGDLIPVQMLQKLYRHSSITTTIGYQANFMYRDADAALETVIGS
jgi:integrase/recombinase XerD